MSTSTGVQAQHGIRLIALSIMIAACGALAASEPLSEQGSKASPVDETRSLVDPPPPPTHVIRLHGVRTSDDNGTHLSPVSAAAVTNALPTLNDIFQGTGIAFAFDPATDFETRNSTLLNQRYEVLDDPAAYTDEDQMPPYNNAPYNAARRALADEHRDKLTIVFAKPQILSFNESLGHWTLVNATGNSSGGLGRWVSWVSSVNGSDLGHEIGHYLHEQHTHVANLTTVQEASDHILAYLTAGNLPQDGLNALNGDGRYVLDTAPDAAGSIFNDAYGAGANCGPQDTVNIPVTFNNSQYNYALTPDRTNIMSYFKGCFVGQEHFSPNQKTRLRDAIELMNRRSLSSHQPSASSHFENVSNQTAGTITDLAMTRVANRRVVTATTGGSVLKLIVWDVGSTGLITRRGDITVGPHTGPFAVSDAGMSQVAIAYRSSTGLLTLKSFAINSAGDLALEDAETGEAISDVAITRYSTIQLATPVKQVNGTLRVVAWEVRADGQITRLAHGDGPLVTAIDTAAFTPDNDEAGESVAGAVVVHARANSSAGGLAVHTFEIVNAGSTQVQFVDSNFAGPIIDVATTAVDFDVSASVAITSTYQQKVILWETDYFGAITRKADYTLTDCTSPAATGIGTRLLATACRVPSTWDIVMSLFEVGTEGATLTLRDQLSAGTGQSAALAQIGHDMMMVARKVYPGNYLMMQSYRIED